MLYRSHRGGVYYTPENTMPAFLDALEKKFDYILGNPPYVGIKAIDKEYSKKLKEAYKNLMSEILSCKEGNVFEDYIELMGKQAVFSFPTERRSQ